MRLDLNMLSDFYPSFFKLKYNPHELKCINYKHIDHWNFKREYSYGTIKYTKI